MKIPSGWHFFKLNEVTSESRKRAVVGNRINLPVFGVSNQTGLNTTSRYHAENLDRYKVIEPGMFAYNPMRLNIGSIGYCTKDIGTGLVSPDYVVFSCNEKQLNSQYLYYYVQNHHWKHWMQKAGAGSVRVRIYYKDIGMYPIILPPIHEQQKILEILSTWDNAIELTNQLIIAEQQLKKGLEQHLLTGKTRLSGFDNTWNDNKLGDLGTTYSGLSGKTKDDFGVGKPYITYRNIFENNKIDKSKLEFVKIRDGENQNKVQYGDILFTLSSETPDEVGMCSVLLDNLSECYLNSFCFGFRLNDFKYLIPEYACFLFRSDFFRRNFFKLAQGSTRYNISKREVLKLTVKLPSIKEQKKIAALLTDCDSAIDLYSKNLVNLKQQKRSLMQKLFSGQIRVKV